MLQPKKTKFRKFQKKRINIFLKKINPQPSFGDCALQIIESGILTAKHIETCRKTISNGLNRQGKIWLRIFPDQPQTKKPNEVRMGRGKGDLKEWAAKVRPGRIFIELAGVERLLLIKVLLKIKYKLPFHTRIIFKEK
jgi:large subunit ribosomal protein L16